MAVVSKAVLKTYFQDGKEPDENKYIDFIDSMFLADGSQIISGGLAIGAEHPQTLKYGHLFIHDGSAQDYGFIEAEGVIFLSSNTYFDGSVWRTIKTGKAATFYVSLTTGLIFRGDNTSRSAGAQITTSNKFGVNLLGHAFISGGLYIGSSSPVTTAGRLQITENLYTGGAVHADGIICSYGSGSGKAGSTGGIEIEWDGVQSDILSYNRNAASYLPIRIRGSKLTFTEATTNRMVIDGGNIIMTANAAISGGLYVGGASPVTTAGRIKATDHLYLGKGVTIGYVSGAANADGINIYVGTALKGEIYADTGWLRFNQNTGIPSYTPQYFYGAAGLRAGSAALAPSGGDITFADRIIKDHQGSDKSGNIYVPVTPDIQGVSWWAHAKSTGGTWITVSTTFPGIPSNVRAINVRILCRDSATHPRTAEYFIIGPDTTTNDNVGVRAHGNNMIGENTGICNVTNNNIYAYRVTSGTNTMDCWLTVIGYFI
jgi:hypothetical protein